jgi:hypothetical protein
MARAGLRHRPGALSIVTIGMSILASAAISLAMDAVLVGISRPAPIEILIGAVLFNMTCVLQSAVGGIIEWQRPGHTIGRLLMLSGPLYALLAAGWLTADALEPFIDPQVYRVVDWGGALLSYPGVALIVGWVPLCSPPEGSRVLAGESRWDCSWSCRASGSSRGRCGGVGRRMGA